jgi:hypothetical protein
MSKKISLVDIKNENKVYDQKKRIDLSEDAYVVIYPHFSPTKITELIKEMITDQQRAEEVGIKFDQINMSDWFLFNIIYKFADLGIPSEIKKKVQAFAHLIDYKYFGQIIESFPQESIKSFEESFFRFKENFDLLTKENGLLNDDVIEELLEKENNAQ